MENVATEEFISRTEALEDFESCNAENPYWTPQRVKTLLLRQPAADVAEVVRCKDCKYGDYDSKPNGAMVCLRTKDGFWREETDFCSYGKRREE
jgi:hypothetical protein